MARKPSIAKLTNSELLDALSIYQYRAGDDLSVYTMTESDHRRGEKMKAEVLRRMNAPVSSTALSSQQRDSPEHIPQMLARDGDHA